MKRTGILGLVPALLAVAVSRLLPAAADAATAKLDIDLAHPGHAIPPTFYGLMTEEINHSYDGGLFAELIQNRTFQDPGTVDGVPPHWSAAGTGRVSTNRIDPVNAALPVNLRLELAGGAGGVANDGYWGIPVRPDTTYAVTFYARANVGFNGAVTASLVTDAGQATVVQAESEPLTAAWKKYTLAFTTPATAPTTAQAKFELTAAGRGSIDFSFVSLFPPTYRDVASGLRPDLMKLMAAMHPAFIRLPGGNYVEGDRFSDRFNWKKMIGPADRRPGHMGCWGYRSSDGFGLPEYLLWCQQLGAEPVLAVFAGYTLNGDHFNAGDPEMDIYTREALQEIEYVTGPADSTWGRRRAADGFLKPFPLHYVEIGNEDFFDKSGSYEGRFAIMARAIRAKYPQLKIIATTPVKSFKPDLVDDHLYASFRSMLAESDRHGAGTEVRKAGGPEVFMGEWASQGGNPTPNLRSALSDAVFAMGLERNSDAVVMECYAPMFANVNPADEAKNDPRGWEWPTNLIGYDALHSFGSPSYQVLAMFGQNKGDVVLPTTFEVPTQPKPVDLHPHGRVGVGTYDTQVEYTDIAVTAPDGRKLSPDNLLAGSGQWTFPRSRWTVEDGVIHPRGMNPQSLALFGDTAWDNYTVRLRARKLGGREGFIVLWHSADGDNYRWWNLGGWGNTVSRCEVAEDGGRSAYGPGTPFTVRTGRWYDLRLEVQGHRVRGYVDDQLVLDVTDEPPATVMAAYASASYAKTGGEVIVKLVNVGAKPLETQIDLHGAGQIGARGTAIVLAGDPTAVNSIAHPDNVAPKTEPLNGVSSSFVRTLPAHSVTLLRFPARR